MSRTWGVIVWGATGFVGRLVVEHLVRYPPQGISWAVGACTAPLLRKDHQVSASPLS